MIIEIKDLITLVGILVSLIIGLVSIYIGFKNSKKTIFINSVTASRVRWIDTIRNTIAEFCSLASLITLDSGKVQDEKLYRLHQLMFLIKLQLNREDDFDSKIISIVKSIYDEIYTDNQNQYMDIISKIDKLIELTQDLLKLEWEGVKAETKKGNLSNWKKRKLYKRYLKSF